MESEVIELQDERFLLRVGGRADLLGPFTKRELVSLLKALKEWRQYG